MVVSRRRDSERKSDRRDPEHYRGRAWAGFIAQRLVPHGGVRIPNVFHETGSRSHWPVHSGGQFLLVLAREGRSAPSDGQTCVVRTGDCAYASRGEMHRARRGTPSSCGSLPCRLERSHGRIPSC